MSRIGKKNILVPENVSIEFPKNSICISGKFGKLEKIIPENISLHYEENNLKIERKNDSKEVKALHGLTRVLIHNMILGVTEQFTKILITEGVGYKFQLDKNQIILSIGYSHLVKIDIPNNLTVKIESPTKLSITGIDKEKVGLLAANIRNIRPPEPYKGKGIRYQGEKILRKAGKTRKKK